MSHGLDDNQGSVTGWYYSISPPASFTYKDQGRYQKRIDSAIGTRNGRSLIKLAWAPDELRWMPHALGGAAPGYTLPIFWAGTDDYGRHYAAPRWVLLERVEPEQFAPQWEQGRYSVKQGTKEVWDWKGPCPSERYIELRCHSYHDGNCCACRGDACECGVQYDHCWGEYTDPDDHLFQWLCKTAHEAKNDPDVDPLCDARSFVAPQAQRDLVSNTLKSHERQQEDMRQFNEHMLSHYLRRPHTVSGFNRTESGIYLLN